MTEATFNSIAGGDGAVVNANQSSWATARGAATGTSVTNTQAQPQASKEAASNFTIHRCFFPLDTSSIPSGATITSATFRFYFDNQGLNDADNGSLILVPTSQASTSSLTTADFDAVSFSNGGSISVSSIVLGQNLITFNATGLTFFTKGGVSKIGLVLSNDFNNTEPTGFNTVNAINTSEESDAAKKPLFTINYSIPGNQGHVF